MTLKTRIAKLETRRGTSWTDCPDPCHLPPSGFGGARPMDYRAALGAMMPPEMRDGYPPEPTCPTCGEPPSGITVVAVDWREGHGLPADWGPD